MRCRNKWCNGKATNITDSECVSVALGIQQTNRMQRIILPSIAYPALQYFSTLAHKGHDFRKKNIIELQMCILTFPTTLVEIFC